MIFLVQDIPEKSALPLEELSEENIRHLKAVRPNSGEEVAFLNLRGEAKIYVVESAKPLRLRFARLRQDPPSQPRTHLFLAPPADSALEQAIEQGTEVGYDEFHFVRTARVQIPKDKALPVARLKRVVQASCKQCGRLWAPQIHEKMLSLEEALALSDDWQRVCADEKEAQKTWGSATTASPLSPKSDQLAIFIGPEGGWSPEEQAQLRAKTQVFSLGPHVLRVPTAVVSAYALAWKELSHG